MGYPYKPSPTSYLGNVEDDDGLQAHEDWDQNLFRVKPNHRLVNDFYLAIGRGVAEMPCLKYIGLESEQSLGAVHDLFYDATGSVALLDFVCTPGFSVEARVLEVWRQATKKNTGTELEVSMYRETLPLR